MQRATVLLRRVEPYGREALWRLREAGPAKLSAILLGFAVPTVLFGPAVFAIFFVFAFVLALPAFRDRILRWRFRDLFLSWPGLLAGLTAIWWALACVFSLDPWASAEVVVRIAAFVAAGVALTVTLAERPDLRRLAEHVFLATFAASVVLAVAAMYGADGLLRLFAPFKGDLTDAVTFFKSYMSVVAIAMPVTLWIGWRRGGWWFAMALAAAVAGAFLLLGDGRQPGRAASGGLLAAGGALVALRVLAPLAPPLRTRVLAGLTLAVAGLGLAVMLSLPSPPVSEADRDDPPLPMVDFHRQAIWGFTFDKALERPILGHGINVINKVPGAHDEVLNLNQEYVPSHPHNWVLEVMAETGVPGLLLFLAAQIALALAFVRGALAGRAGARVGLATMAAFWVSSLANFSIWSAWWQVAYIAILVLPAARMIGPLTDRREEDVLPRPDWRRIALIALAAVMALALAFVWYARRTEEGYILYKRLKADSPYLYEEIAPAYRAVDPAPLIDAEDPADLEALRAGLRRAIWGVAGLPSERQPEKSEAQPSDPYGLTDGIEGAAVERVTMPITANYASVGYILTPANPTGEAVVYQHGYAGDLSQMAALIRTLLEDGITVAALNFPGYAENAYYTYRSEQFGPIEFDHDFGLYYLERPMRLYIEPAIVIANRLRATHGAVSVDIVGFSAGGWISAIAAAADPRFRHSVSVASFLPIYLRNRKDPAEWTPPHLYAPLIQATNYLEIPLLAGTGEGRSYLQVFNRYDRCCYMNRRGALYQDAVAARIDALGLGGAFGVAIDETHARHQVSPWALGRLVEFLETGAIRDAERHPPWTPPAE